MGELNFIMQNYFQTGKPEAVQPVKIEYRTNAGKGVINMDLVRFFPASAHDIKVLIDTLWMSADTYETAGIIADYLKKVIADLQIIRGDRENYCNQDCADASKINGFIKKYLSNLDKIADAFGLETVADDRATVKMTKCEVVIGESMCGKSYAKIYPAKSFKKSGYVWAVFKYAKGVYRVAMPGTGYYIVEYAGKEKEAPEHITAQIVDRVNTLRAKNPGIFEELHKKLCDLCEVSNIPAPILPECMKENTNVSSLDAEKEPQTKEPEKVQTAEKPAHNVIKRSTAHIVARWKIETCAGAVGDLFDIKKTENGWTGENITRKNGKFYNIPIAGLRNSELVEIVKQETAKEYFAHIMNNIITTEPKPADPTPETGNRPQVWKPCTMTPARRNAIIYIDILCADRQQKSPAREHEKRLLRLAKLQGYINIPLTAENPFTGKIQAHNRHIIGTAYTPEPIPGKPPHILNYYGIVNRRVPRFEIRGSPKIHEKKIGGFCGVYIRPPGGYLKVSR